ncbi:hypothetical protein EV363DRAFT_1568850 [Boletus edulis]|nr:hypothetical protein EV363DRAFT_1568850 [Boletus edulis]
MQTLGQFFEPLYTPQDTLESACDAPAFIEHHTIDAASRQAILGVPAAGDLSPADVFAPFTNPTSGILMAWQYSGTNQKSASELNRLAQLQTHPLYDSQDLKTFSHACEAKRLNQFLDSKSNPFHTDYGWHQSSVQIQLPKEQAMVTSETEALQMTIDGIWHHNLTDIITNIFESDTALSFNMMPFKAYSSPEMLHAYEEINALPREPGDDMERIVASLMVWSDATHMTNFGDASMWPFYLYFGNQSKYARGKPTAAACHHLAYIPKLPDNFQDIYRRFYGIASTQDIYTHCKRELFQAVWDLLLDERFMDAFRNGIVVRRLPREVVNLTLASTNLTSRQ